MSEENVNYKCLIVVFGLLTFVYLLSEYTIYKLDSFLDECLDAADAVVEINIHIHGDNASDPSHGDERRDEVEVNSTMLHKLLSALLIREKRQSSIPVIPGYVCTADLFKKVDMCCPTPVFMSEWEMQNCNRRRYARSASDEEQETTTESVAPSRNLSESLIDLGYDGGPDDYYDDNLTTAGDNTSVVERPAPPDPTAFYFRWSPVRLIQVPQRRYYATNNRMQQRTQSQPMIGRRTPTRHICMVDCMFRSLRWISPESVLNVDLMFTSMTAMVPPSWGSLLSTAKSDCSSIIAGPGLIENVRDGNGKVCLVAPIKLMRCIKRSLMMGCPSFLNSGPQCTADMNVLKSCDILSL